MWETWLYMAADLVGQTRNWAHRNSDGQPRAINSPLDSPSASDIGSGNSPSVQAEQITRLDLVEPFIMRLVDRHLKMFPS